MEMNRRVLWKLRNKVVKCRLPHIREVQLLRAVVEIEKRFDNNEPDNNWVRNIIPTKSTQLTLFAVLITVNIVENTKR